MGPALAKPLSVVDVDKAKPGELRDLYVTSSGAYATLLNPLEATVHFRPAGSSAERGRTAWRAFAARAPRRSAVPCTLTDALPDAFVCAVYAGIKYAEVYKGSGDVTK